MSGASGAKRRFQLVLIKPSHYDDDGYVIQWLRSVDPVELARRVYTLAARRRRAAGARVRRRDRHHRHRRDQHPGPARRRHRAVPQPRRLRHGRPGRRAVEPVPARRSTSRAAAAPAGIAGGDRRLPRLRLPGDAAGDARPTCRPRSTSAARCSPARPRGRLDEVLRDAAAGTLKPIYNYMDDLPSIEATPTPYLPRATCVARLRQPRQLRRRPRLPVPVLVLHHHQRAGPQVAPPHARRHRAADHAHTGPQGVRRFFITDDNFARNKDWEPIFDRLIEIARAGQDRHPPDHPGRHAVPQDPELHRQGAARRRDAGVHRAGEHQSGEPARGQEAAEQDHRIPHDAAGLEAGRRHHLCGLHHRLPGRHARSRSSATSRSSRRNCRSTSWSSSS